MTDTDSPTPDFPADEILDRWASLWIAGDIDGLTALWDAGYPNKTFLGTETDRWVSSMEEIRAYYSMLERWQPDRWDVSDVTVDRLADDLVTVRCKMRMAYRMPGFEGVEASVWRGRCWMIWRHTADGWRLIHKEDSTNEFDRAVNILRRVEDGQTANDLVPILRGYERFVPARDA